ncbi:MAG: hypothetical protein LBC41_14255 [Clostridiales bacterium]|nr:hypothetical protein [Clostridiales bacterium]
MSFALIFCNYVMPLIVSKDWVFYDQKYELTNYIFPIGVFIYLFSFLISLLVMSDYHSRMPATSLKPRRYEKSVLSNIFAGLILSWFPMIATFVAFAIVRSQNPSAEFGSRWFNENAIFLLTILDISTLEFMVFTFLGFIATFTAFHILLGVALCAFQMMLWFRIFTDWIKIDEFVISTLNYPTYLTVGAPDYEFVVLFLYGSLAIGLIVIIVCLERIMISYKAIRRNK